VAADDPILVFGATGTHGGAVARALIAEAVPVHAFVRDPRSQRAQSLAESGATLVRGDLDDERSIVQALEAVSRAYLVTTPFEGGAETEQRQGEAVVRAAIRAELSWLIFASVAAAERATVAHFVSKAHIERRLSESPLAWTVLAPSYFYENVLGARDAISNGELPLAVPTDTPVHQIALADLGAVVAAVLRRQEEHQGIRVELAADAPTPREMAAALGVRHIQTPIAEVRERSNDLADMYSFLAEEGYGIDVTAVRQRYPEVPWTTFAAWAASLNREAW
jgi:uncharacterized protein YbjT (DUF2867 family)